MQVWAVTMRHGVRKKRSIRRHGVTRKRSTKRSKHTKNLFRKNLQLKDSVNSKLKGYLCYKTITYQNALSEAQVKNYFYSVEMLCFIIKIFKFLYFLPFHDLPNL